MQSFTETIEAGHVPPGLQVLFSEATRRAGVWLSLGEPGGFHRELAWLQAVAGMGTSEMPEDSPLMEALRRLRSCDWQVPAPARRGSVAIRAIGSKTEPPDFEDSMVWIDGVLTGSLDAAGQRVIGLPPGNHSIVIALRAGNVGAGVVVPVTSGEGRTIDILLDEGKEVYREADGIHRESPPGIDLRDPTAKAILAIAGITTVDLERENGGEDVRLEGHFAVRGARIVVIDEPRLYELLRNRPPLTRITILATDTRELDWAVTIPVALLVPPR